MPDPLSMAAGVAGLIALAGTTSKLFYQFFRSIHDAPSIARDLTSTLYTLNIALSQIQGSLLRPDFVSVADDEQLEAIQNCLTSCAATFDMVRTRVEASGLAVNDQPVLKKGWASVKASFNEEQMQDCLRRVESEKTTLLLVVDIFSARLNADIMNQVQETKHLVQKQDRRLKDINVFCRWIIGNEASDRKGKSGLPKEMLQATAFSLSSAYDRSDIAKMLQDSGSVLSLKLGDVSGESVGAIWEPESEPNVPFRRISSQLEIGRPSKDSEGYFQSPFRTLPISFGDFGESISTLKKLSTRDNFDQTRSKELLTDYCRKVVKGVRNVPFFGPSLADHYDLILDMTQAARELNSDVYDDLQYLERSYTMMERHWIDHTADENLPPLFLEVNKATLNYLQWAGTVMKGSQPGRKRIQQTLKDIIKAEPNEFERKRLKRTLFNAVERARDYQATLGSIKMRDMQLEQHNMQCQQKDMQLELLAQQNQMANQIQMLLDRQLNANRTEEADDPRVVEDYPAAEEDAADANDENNSD